MASTVIKIKEGAIRGKEVTATSFRKKKYFSFQGIPYAQPPVGNLRFKDPVPVTSWDGVRDTLKEAPLCPQKHVILRRSLGEEDNCLALNVYTPRLPEAGSALLPVMVWIHGGGFTFGSGNTDLHDPEYWMEQDVVIVTCNYRVGVLGFLSLGTSEVPGNAGLKDQVMVLKWVQWNIAQFGGDPNNVTMFGESAGSASVHYHLLSPMSRGLFHRAILMSGSSLNTWAFSSQALEKSFSLGEKLGLSTSDPKKLLEFLQNLPVFDLVKMQNKVLTAQDKQDLRVFPFVPSVELSGGAEQRFLTEHPRTILQRGDIAPVPVIFGANNKEGMLVMNDVPHNDELFKVVNSNFSRILPGDLGLPNNAADKLRRFFFGKKDIGWGTISDYFDYYGDVFFYLGIDEAVRHHLASGKAPVYCYWLSYDGGQGLLSHFLRLIYHQCELKGVCHADDVGYMFKSNLPGAPELTPGSPDEHMVSTITGLWREFASTGNPNKEEQVVKWAPAILEGSSWKRFLEINNPLEMKNSRMAQTRMEFWETLLRPEIKQKL
ncbi:esterase FE4-like isoform X2 [Macrosteles quadrilineatus]|nr:esterase FE4-like isoform X2 [Macrosteles quadrilineatus]XP_054259145.1 esterase FE4-like isoform X2 [Macrosteles quadrilineatus]XP_054259146.1 esterase FE4-like isoform X2 [Macrosteles quadrilineatus]XP_054259147.1 esterase FE4-like isoform X2 [Macrosteles quadrilineatus]